MRDSDIDALSANGAQGRASDWYTPSEAQWLKTVEDLASLMGWTWLHIDPAVNDRGYWRTPVRGPLGRGFPDLFMVKGRRRLAAELKVGRASPSYAQEEVLEKLREAGMECYVWRPEQLDEVREILGARP